MASGSPFGRRGQKHGARFVLGQSHRITQQGRQATGVRVAGGGSGQTCQRGTAACQFGAEGSVGAWGGDLRGGWRKQRAAAKIQEGGATPLHCTRHACMQLPRRQPGAAAAASCFWCKRGGEGRAKALQPCMNQIGLRKRQTEREEGGTTRGGAKEPGAALLCQEGERERKRECVCSGTA